LERTLYLTKNNNVDKNWFEKYLDTITRFEVLMEYLFDSFVKNIIINYKIIVEN